MEVFFDRDACEDVVFRNAWTPNYQARDLGGDVFLSNAAGEWAFVSRSEFHALRSVALPMTLYQRLEARHLIITRTNSTTFFEAYSKWATPHFRHPIHHIIVSTLRCNLACTYCHADVRPPSAGPSYDLDEATADAILDFAINSKAPVQSFEFQGGESLLNGRVLRYIIPRIRLAYQACGKQVYVSIQTNATLLSGDWMQFFDEYDVSVGSSLDGPTEIHDAQRPFVGGKGSFAVVKRKIDTHRIPILPTVTRHSLPMWREIIEEQLRRGQQVVTFQNVYPINSAKRNWASVGMSFAEFLEYYDRAVEYLKNAVVRWLLSAGASLFTRIKEAGDRS